MVRLKIEGRTYRVTREDLANMLRIKEVGRQLERDPSKARWYSRMLRLERVKVAK